MPTRRGWRSAFRRARLYIPFGLLVLIAMVVRLPLSADWMARAFERRIRVASGLDVRIENLRIVLSRGEVLLRGVALHGPDSGEPFRVDSVLLTGSGADLIAGDGRWPAVIEIVSPSPLHVAFSEGEPALQGAAETLRRAFEGARRTAPALPRTEGEHSPVRSDTAFRESPQIVLRDALVKAATPNFPLPELGVFVEELTLARRDTATAPFLLKARGVAHAGSSEPWTFDGVWKPGTARASAHLTLHAAGLDFRIPQLGAAEAALREIDILATLAEAEGDGPALQFTADITTRAAEFALRRPGVERWIDRDLRARLRLRFDPRIPKLEVSALQFTGETLAAAASGSAELRGAFPGNATVEIQRVPPALVSFARRELLSRTALELESLESSPTLQLRVAASGEFGNPESMDASASIAAAGWAMIGPGWPARVVLQGFDATATNERFALDRLDLIVGDLRLQANGFAPTLAAPEGTTGTLHVRAEGDASIAVEIGQRYEFLAPEISAARIPLLLDGTIALRSRPQAIAAESLSGTLSWKRGELLLTDLAEPLRLEPGALEFEDGTLTVHRFVATLGDLSARLRGTLEGLGPLGDRLPRRVAVDLMAEGRIESAVPLLAQFVAVPFPHDRVRGAFSAELTADAQVGAWLAPEYALRLRLSDVETKLEIPFNELHLRKGTADFSLTTASLTLHALSVEFNDAATSASTVTLTGGANETTMAVSGDVRTTFEMLQRALPWEFQDLICEGPLPASLSGTLTARTPLEPGADIVRRWYATIAKRADTIGIAPDSALQLKFRVDYTPTAPVSFFGRDFPIRIDNVRGNAWVTEEGVFWRGVVADVGSSKDLVVDGSVIIGRPVRLTFDARGNRVNITEWLSGWGEKPWAKRPFAYAAPRKATRPAIGEPRKDRHLLFIAEGTVRAQRTDFFDFRGQDLSGALRVDVWSGHHDTLTIRDVRARGYEGAVQTDATFEFHRGTGTKANITGAMQDVQAQPFLSALLGRPEELAGRLTGDIEFEGILEDEDTYVGAGRFRLDESPFVGTQIARSLRALLELGSDNEGRDTTIQSTFSFADRRIRLPDLIVVNPKIRMAAEGTITFGGLLDLALTANVLSQRFESWPVIGGVFSVVDRLGDALLSFRVSGTVREPSITPVPLMMDRVSLKIRVGNPGAEPKK